MHALAVDESSATRSAPDNLAHATLQLIKLVDAQDLSHLPAQPLAIFEVRSTCRKLLERYDRALVVHVVEAPKEG